MRRITDEFSHVLRNLGLFPGGRIVLLRFNYTPSLQAPHTFRHIHGAVSASVRGGPGGGAEGWSTNTIQESRLWVPVTSRLKEELHHLHSSCRRERCKSRPLLARVHCVSALSSASPYVTSARRALSPAPWLRHVRPSRSKLRPLATSRPPGTLTIGPA